MAGGVEAAGGGGDEKAFTALLVFAGEGLAAQAWLVGGSEEEGFEANGLDGVWGFCGDNGGGGIAGDETAGLPIGSCLAGLALVGLGAGLVKAAEASPAGLEKRAEAEPLAGEGETTDGVANMDVAAGAGDAADDAAKGEVC